MHVYSVLAHRGYAVSYYRSQKCILVGKKKKDLILHFYIGQQTSLFSPLCVSTPPLITTLTQAAIYPYFLVHFVLNI